MGIFIYFGVSMPKNTWFHNSIEIFNEIQVTLCTFHLMVWTDWVPDYDMQYEMGWVFIIILSSCILVNMIFIIWHMIREIYFFLKKWWKRFIAWLRRICKKKPPPIKPPTPPPPPVVEKKPEPPKAEPAPYQPMQACLVGGKVTKMVNEDDQEIDRVIMTNTNQTVADDNWKHQAAPVEIEKPEFMSDMPSAMIKLPTSTKEANRVEPALMRKATTAQDLLKRIME